MLTRLPRNVLVGVLTTALLSAGPAAAQYSSVTDLGDLGGGASVASSINDRGQVAGASLRDDSTQGGFIWQDGTMTDLGSLGGTATVAYAINNRGQVVGASTRAEDASVGAFVWQDGVMIDLGGAFSFRAGHQRTRTGGWPRVRRKPVVLLRVRVAARRHDRAPEARGQFCCCRWHQRAR